MVLGGQPPGRVGRRRFFIQQSSPTSVGLAAFRGCHTCRTLTRLTGEAVTIRRCHRDDVDAVLRLWAAGRSGHASTPDHREDVERLLDDGPAALIVAEDSGRLAGAVIAGWDGWRGNIYRLTVEDGYRRRGIGRRLTKAAEEYLRSRGARRITALVAYDDERAGSFWDSAGYPQDAEIGRRVRNI